MSAFLIRDRPVTVSIGLARGPMDSFAELVKRADEALYRAKESGRNLVGGPSE